MNSAYKRRRLRSRRERKQSGMPLWLIALLSLATLGSLGLVVSVGVVYAAYQHYAEGYVPIEERIAQHYAGLTEIYDRDGEVLLGTLANPDAQLLDPIPLERISEWMIQATISTEDNSFYDNTFGVNVRGLVRAAWENYVKDDFGAGSGGSSITQQLIKNVYLSTDCEIVDGVRYCVAPRTVDRKLREIAYAYQLEKDYSKDQILELYLNQISYADRYVGVEAASQGYFRKPAAELSLAEAALLAGIPQFPGLYHPRLNCIRGNSGDCVFDEEGRITVGGAAKGRQEEVLDLMVTHGRATPTQIAAAKAEVIKVYPSVSELLAAAWVDNQIEPRLVRMCQAGILPLISGSQDCIESVHNAGYKVITTLDWEANQAAQALAQAEVADGLAKGSNAHNTAIVTIDPSNGQIIVYVSTVDPDNTTDPRVAGDIDQANDIHQPGSSFKPAVYLAWFDVLNKTPMDTFWDTSPLNIQGTNIVNPRSGGGSEGLISARAGLGGSQNVPAVRAAAEAGVDNVIAIAQKLGITTLAQNFDPTFVAHQDISYGASIATGGANIRVIDMAYMNATFANMGVMVGVPHLARIVEISDLKGTFTHEGAEWDLAIQQKLDFQRGNLRIPNTRALDPVVILRVEGPDGTVLYDHETAGDLEYREVVDPGSVWLLHSIMSDCTARFIIWGCGGDNRDLRLDFSVTDTGQRVPAGVKTGTQQGFLSAADTLEVWTTGYSRYSATAVWVGNSNKELVRDGPGAGFASAHAVLWLYKGWQGQYHSILYARGVFESPAGFDALRPGNIRATNEHKSPSTDRTIGGSPAYCGQKVTTWIKVNVEYEDPCEKAEIDTRNGLLAGPDTPAEFREEREFVKLPELGRDQAIRLAQARNIPIKPEQTSTGQALVSITSPVNAATISAPTPIVGRVQPQNLEDWTLEIGLGGAPTEWTTLGTGTTGITDQVLATVDPAALETGVYTIRLSARYGSGVGTLSVKVTVNVIKATPTPPGPTPSPTPGGPTPTPSPTPQGN